MFIVGDQVLFTGHEVRRDVTIVDIITMYSSVIMDGGISPESIDFIDMPSVVKIFGFCAIELM